MALIWRRQGRSNAAPRMSMLKHLIWAYFLLLIFEGALRKWIIPSLSAPLLLVRDPVALLIIWEAYRTRKWPKQWVGVISFLALSMLVLCVVQVILGENPWFIALYGLRSYLLPFPVAFIMGENLDAEDLRKFGVFTLWVLLPEVGIEIAQYLAPANSLLNKGAYEGMTQIGYAGEHVRASGTFSFPTGPIYLGGLAAAFVFYGLVNNKFAKRWLIFAATIALVISIPVIGSRALILTLAEIVAFVMVAALFGVSQFAATLKIIPAILVAVLLAMQLPVFSAAMDTLQKRLGQAAEAEGGNQGTFTARVASPVEEATNFDYSTTSWYGNGMGIGSNVAAQLLTGTPQFLGGEGETSRLLFELGPFFGPAFLLFRVLLTMMIAFKAFMRVRDQLPLAWLLVPALLAAPFGALEQPTIQGFMVLNLGFALAALNLKSEESEKPPIANPRPGRIQPRAFAGRRLS